VILLKDKKNVSEFKLAEKLKIGVNQVRNMLYRINEYNLVYYTRKKDKKKGWYIYYWTFDDKEANNLIRTMKKKKLQRLKDKVKNEVGGTFFVCTEGCVRMDYADALENGFVCSECGTRLVQLENQKYIDSLNEQVRVLEADLAEPEPVIKRSREPAKKPKRKIKKAVKKIAKKPKRKIKKVIKKIFRKKTKSKKRK
jgi:transcription initiation factor TFIIE subunit alpha